MGDVSHVDRFCLTFSERTQDISGGRRIIYQAAEFTSDMSPEDIRHIIRTLAIQGWCSLHEMSAVPICGIIFQAVFASWADDTRDLWEIPEARLEASAIMAQGWEGLQFIAWAWQLLNVWDLATDETIPWKMREEWLQEATKVTCVLDGSRNRTTDLIEYLDIPAMYRSYVIFRELYPNFGLPPHSWLA
jgi:hypothetical protein